MLPSLRSWSSSAWTRPKAPAVSDEELYEPGARSTRTVLTTCTPSSPACSTAAEFMEYKKGYGPEMITGLAKVDGLLVGVVAN